MSSKFFFKSTIFLDRKSWKSEVSSIHHPSSTTELSSRSRSSRLSRAPWLPSQRLLGGCQGVPKPADGHVTKAEIAFATIKIPRLQQQVLELLNWAHCWTTLDQSSYLPTTPHQEQPTKKLDRARFNFHPHHLQQLTGSMNPSHYLVHFGRCGGGHQGTRSCWLEH